MTLGLLAKELDEGGVEAMLYDLLQRDIRQFNHRQVPSTKGLIDQKLLSLEPHQEWYYGELQNGRFTVFSDEWEFVLKKDRLHDDYVESLKKNGATRRSNETALGMCLRRLCPEGYPRRVKTKRLVDNIPLEGLYYQFPSLAVCRKHFEALVGLQGYDWEGEDSAGEPELATPVQPF